VVLNQIDLLPAEQVRDCAEDLRRLLDAENLTDTPVLPISARTGDGLPELRALLMETMQHNRAVTDRIAADIDAIIGGFVVHAGPRVAPEREIEAAPIAAPISVTDDQLEDLSRPPWDLDEDEQAGALAPPVASKPPWEDATPDGSSRDAVDPSDNVPIEPAATLTEAFAGAAGLAAVAQAMASARATQAARLTSWPAARLRGGSVPALRAAGGSDAIRQAAAAAVGYAQQSEVDNAITAFADSVGGGLPEPWGASLREAARSNASLVPQALADAVTAGSAASRSKPPGWWRLIAAWQWLLMALAVVGVLLSVVIAIVRLTGHHTGTLSDVALIPWLLTMTVAMLVLGYLTALGCRNVVVAAAGRERETAERVMRDRVAGVTHDLVLHATGLEIAQYEQFRSELSVASGNVLS
jgi:hypothetical protein